MSWMRVFMVLAVVLLVSCSSGSVHESSESLASAAGPNCLVSSVRYPTTQQQFLQLYNGRGFYADGNHLGRDIALAEGVAIHPIACGIVRIYRAASGYGSLVVVIEHRLPRALTVTNGRGELVSITNFLSIYGHLRSTTGRNSGASLAIRVGDTVRPDDVIGYVQNDADNGDGAEHLHLGIRLQAVVEAQQSDASWFRGYDAAPSQRRFYADPQEFLPALMRSGTPVRSHPAGTVMTTANASNQYWVLDEDQVLHPLTAEQLRRERLHYQVVVVDSEELRCYAMGSPYRSFMVTDNVGVYHFSDRSTVYEINTTTREARAFVSYEAFTSWGWTEFDIHRIDEPFSFFAYTEALVNGGVRRLRDGALVKGAHQSEIAVVSHGRRLPIDDWQTFLALGYDSARIIEVDDKVLDEVAFSRGPLVTAESSALCLHPSLCLSGTCDAGRVGGGVGDGLDAGTSMAFTDVPATMPTSDIVHVSEVGALRPTELCNGLDDDGNGLIDEIFLCPLGRTWAGCQTSCGTNGLRRCAAPACSWSETCQPYAETCNNTIDDDCDGRTDCEDPDCLMTAVCQMTPGMLADASLVVDVSTSADVAVPSHPEVSVRDASAPDVGSVVTGTRYEFRILERAGWSATSPYRLRDLWWAPVVCQNTLSTTPEAREDGWQRCDLRERLSPFVGSFFSPAHMDWGDRGQLGTVGNAPERCTPTDGVEWRITDLASGRSLFTGPADRLPCTHVGSQDRHSLP